MSTPTSTRPRSTGALGRWGARAAALLTAVALVQGVEPSEALVETLTDATVVSVTGDDLRAGLLTAIEGPRVLDADEGCVVAVQEAVLLERYRPSGVSATPAQVTAELRSVTDSWLAARGVDACGRRSFDEGVLDLLLHAETVAGSADLRAAVRRVASRVVALGSTSGNGVGDRGLTVSIDQSDHLLVSTLAPESLLADVAREAQLDPAYAQARDALLGGASGISVRDGLATLLDHPTLASSDLPALVDVGTSQLSATYGTLMGVVEDADADVDAQRDEAIGALTSTGPPPAAEPADGPAGLLLGVGAMLAKARTTAAESVKATVQTVGRAVGAVGKGAVRMWARIVEGVVGSQPGQTRLAKVVALVRGLVSGGHLTVMGLLLPEPMSDQRVLDAIGGLQDDIAELRTEMNSRFDAVDAKLDQILGELVTRFGQVEQRLAQLSSDIGEVRDALVLLSTQVERLERNLYQVIRDGEDRDLWTKVNTAIGWRERSVDGAPMPNAQFIEFEGFFYSWATISAYDAIATGPAARSYADADLVSELGAVPLEGGLSFLSGLGASRFGVPALAEGRLPNLRDYAVAARAYSALLLENPQYVTDGVRQRLDTIRARGQQVATALERLRQRDVPGVGTGSRVFNGALDVYRRAGTVTTAGAAPSVASELLALEQAYLAARRTHLSEPLALDPWGGTDQSSPLDVHVPSDFDACLTNGISGSVLTRPTTMTRATAYTPLMRNAMRLGTVDGRVLCEVTATDRRQTDNNHTADFTVQWRTEFRERSGAAPTWQVALSRTLTFPDVVWCEGPAFLCSELDVMAEVQERWPATFSSPNWKGMFEQSATLSSPGTARLQLLAGAVLRQLQIDVYRHLAGQTGQGALAGALTRLTGARQLLESYAHLALARSMQDDDELRGFFAGAEPLPAEGADRAVASALEAAAASPPAGNARLQIVADLGARADELQVVLRDAVTGAGAGPATTSAQRTGFESNPLVETTVSRLRLTRALTLPAPPPTATPLLTSPRVTSPRLSRLARDPITVTLRSATPGALTARLTISAATARRFRLGNLRVVATRSQAVRSAGSVVVRLRATSTAARRLRPVRQTVPAVLQLTLRAPDGRTARPLVVPVRLRP